MDRREAIRQYAANSGMTVKELLKYKVVVPASVDRPCDEPDCQGWHFYPKGLYTQEDADTGFISEEMFSYFKERV